MKVKAGGPDGVEAWCVALSACFINFVMGGLGRMSGILYVEFINRFQVDRLQASVPFSARSLTRNLFGPVVGILGQKYGVRATTLLGGIVGTVSAAACFYSNSMLWITIMWGALNGIGTALTITIPQVVLSQHFKKYRTTASGLAFSGGCVGSVLFPVLLEYLLYTYGLGGTFLVLSGIIMNVIPAAMILRKPSWVRKSKSNSEMATAHKQNQSDESFHQNKANNRSAEKYNNKDEMHIEKYQNSTVEAFSSNNGPFTWSKVDTKFLRNNNNLLMKLFMNNFTHRERNTDQSLCSTSIDVLQQNLEDFYRRIDNINGTNSSNETLMSTVSSKYSSVEDNSDISQYANTKKEITLSVSKLGANATTECNDSIQLHCNKLIQEDMNNILSSFPKEEHTNVFKLLEQLRFICNMLNETERCDDFSRTKKEQNVNKEIKEKHRKIDENPNSFFAHIKTALKLHTNPLFLLISFCRSVHFLTFVPAVTIIVDFSMDKGLLQDDGKYVIAALSIGDLVGRLCLGWVTDKEYLTLPRYMLIIMVIQGACTASLSLMHSKAALLSLVAIFGLLQGSLFVRHPVLVTKYLGKNEQSVAMGCFNFFSGLLGFALPNYIGYFRDVIGSYNSIFYINGGIGTFVGIMWFFEPYFVKCINSRDLLKDPA